MNWLKTLFSVLLASGLCLLVPNAVAETNKAAKQAEIRQNSERILAALRLHTAFEGSESLDNPSAVRRR